jgi:thiamine pyrophosphate-dependent acetolactate synthase large subunit-like protein
LRATKASENVSEESFSACRTGAAWLVANKRDRGVDRSHIGTSFTDPFINYAMMAETYGMYSEGPISDPKDLGPAIRRGIARVKSGEPALIDVVTQPR